MKSNGKNLCCFLLFLTLINFSKQKIKLCERSIIPSIIGKCYETTQEEINSFICEKFSKFYVKSPSITFQKLLLKQKGKNDCSDIWKICKKLNKSRKTNFMVSLKNLRQYVLNTNNRFNILIINVHDNFLILAHYFFEYFGINLIEFQLVFFKTSSNLLYLHKLNKSKSYTYRLDFAKGRRWDIYHKKNLNHFHENIIYRERSTQNSFRLIKNKEEVCSFFKIISKFYTKASIKNFFLYYLPLIDMQYIKQTGEVLMRYEEFRIKFIPHSHKDLTIADMLKQLSFSKYSFLQKTKLKKIQKDVERPKTFEDELYFESKVEYKTKEKFLEQTINEKPDIHKKKKQNYIFNENSIELYKLEDE
jgi:hypothetical protein